MEGGFALREALHGEDFSRILKNINKRESQSGAVVTSFHKHIQIVSTGCSLQDHNCNIGQTTPSFSL